MKTASLGLAIIIHVLCVWTARASILRSKILAPKQAEDYTKKNVVERLRRKTMRRLTKNVRSGAMSGAHTVNANPGPVDPTAGGGGVAKNDLSQQQQNTKQQGPPPPTVKGEVASAVGAASVVPPAQGADVPLAVNAAVFVEQGEVLPPQRKKIKPTRTPVASTAPPTFAPTTARPSASPTSSDAPTFSPVNIHDTRSFDHDRPTAMAKEPTLSPPVVGNLTTSAEKPVRRRRAMRPTPEPTRRPSAPPTASPVQAPVVASPNSAPYYYAPVAAPTTV